MSAAPTIGASVAIRKTLTAAGRQSIELSRYFAVDTVQG